MHWTRALSVTAVFLPDCVHQFLPGDQAVPMLQEVQEDVKRLLAKALLHPIAAEAAQRGNDLYILKSVNKTGAGE